MHVPESSAQSPARSASWHAALAALAVLAALIAGCGEGQSGTRERTLRVLAASSLDDVLPRVVELFETERPGVEVAVVFGGSQLLATQIEEGAPADVLLSANRLQAQRLVAAAGATRSLGFAANALAVVVREGSPIASVEALAEPGRRVAVGAPDVPVGALTRSALALLDAELAARIRANIVTEDPSVRLVLSRVETGEADAAFVYETDARRGSARDGEALRALHLPAGLPANEYVAVVLAGAGADAKAFADFLASEGVWRLLEAAGFRAPGAAAAR